MTSAPSVPFSRREVVISAGLGVVGIAISAIGSGTASLWGDEAASVLSAERSFPSLARMAQHVDAVHTVYYAALHLGIAVAGASPFAVRFPSAVAVGIAVATVVLLGRRLGGLRYGVLAGILTAVLPRMTDVGSEARSYAFTAAIAVVLTLLFVLQVQAAEPRRRVWIAYGAVLAVGTLLFLWVALVAVSHAVVIASARRRLWRGWLVAFVLAMGGASPVLVLAALERGQIAYLATRQAFDPTALLVTPWFENPWVAVAAWSLVACGAVLAVRDWLTMRRRWHVPTASSSTALVPLIWMLVPSIALIVGSAAIAVYTPRYLTMCAPAVALLAALPLEALVASPRRTRVLTAAVATVALVALIGPVWAQQRTPYAKNNSDWAAIGAVIAARAHPGDAIAFDDTVRPSRRTRLALRMYPADFSGLADVTLSSPWWSSAGWHDSTMSLARARALGRLDGVRRLWLVDYALPGQTSRPGSAAALAAGFHEVTTIRTHRSAIIEYERG